MSKDARVTIRISPREYEELKDFMDTHGFVNVSDFVRDAIAWAIANPKEVGQ